MKEIAEASFHANMESSSADLRAVSVMSLLPQCQAMVDAAMKAKARDTVRNDRYDDRSCIGNKKWLCESDLAVKLEKASSAVSFCLVQRNVGCFQQFADRVSMVWKDADADAAADVGDQRIDI